MFSETPWVVSSKSQGVITQTLKHITVRACDGMLFTHQRATDRTSSPLISILQVF